MTSFSNRETNDTLNFACLYLLLIGRVGKGTPGCSSDGTTQVGGREDLLDFEITMTGLSVNNFRKWIVQTQNSVYLPFSVYFCIPPQLSFISSLGARGNLQPRTSQISFLTTRTLGIPVQKKVKYINCKIIAEIIHLNLEIKKIHSHLK